MLKNNTSLEIVKNYDYIVDGTDNFTAKFLINDLSLKYKKFAIIQCKDDIFLLIFHFSLEAINTNWSSRTQATTLKHGRY